MDIIKHKGKTRNSIGGSSYHKTIPKEYIDSHKVSFYNNGRCSSANGTFKRYKEAASSNFFLEEIVYKNISEYRYSIIYNIIKLVDLDNLELFKSSKFYKQYIKGIVNEVLIADSKFIVKIQNVIPYQELSYYKIEVMLPDDKLLDFFEKWIKKTFEIIEEKKIKKTNINILKEENKQLILVPIEKDFLFEKDNYPLEFEKIHNQIIEDLKKDKGILLLHGEPGTGKTSYIKCLPQFADKTFIFIPPSFGEILVSPSFLSFMMTQKNCVLIIEDAESILRSRKGGQNHAVSNILNLTDGILAEMLGIQIICSLNCNINQIDEAILRPGRLLREYGFGKLSKEQSNELLLKYHPSENYSSNKELTLAEIYNYQNHKTKEAKIGFNR